MPLRADQPTATDALDARRVVTALADVIFPTGGAVPTPLTVGIHGRWGSGKSSILRQLRPVLEKRTIANDTVAGKIERKVRVFEFHPWAYQNEDHLLVPLLLTLIEGAPEADDLKKQALKLAKVTLRFFVNRIPIAAEVAKAGTEQEAEDAAGVPTADLGDLVKFKEQVKEVVEKIRGEQQDILVILIDDLDRCHPPQRVVDLLEQIKVFLDLESCVFVLACDRDVVCSAIETRFPGEGAAYLEKFIQLPVNLPAPQAHVLTGHVLSTQATPGAAGEWTAYWGRVVEVLGHNPRRATRLHNQYLASAAIIRASGTEKGFDDFLLVKWLLLAETVPDVLRDPGLALRIESALADYQPGARWLRQELGIGATLAAFLHMDLGRKFENFSKLSVYSRLSTRENEMTRARAERMAREREPFPAEIGPADFSWAFLPSADFSGHALTGIDFSDANLEGADFSNATLKRCTFARARIAGIKLRGTQIDPGDSGFALGDNPDFMAALSEQNV